MGLFYRVFSSILFSLFKYKLCSLLFFIVFRIQTLFSSIQLYSIQIQFYSNLIFFKLCFRDSKLYFRDSKLYFHQNTLIIFSLFTIFSLFEYESDTIKNTYSLCLNIFSVPSVLSVRIFRILTLFECCEYYKEQAHYKIGK